MILDSVQRTPSKVQGELLGCQEWSWVGSGREFLKEMSSESWADEQVSNMIVMKRYKGWWKRLLSAFIFAKIGFLFVGFVFLGEFDVMLSFFFHEREREEKKRERRGFVFVCVGEKWRKKVDWFVLVWDVVKT